ncbi:MAG: ABC transporter permease, partial [Planctomycetota bacterium]
YFGLIAAIITLSVPGELKKLGKPIGIVDQSEILTGGDGPLANVEFGGQFVFEGNIESKLDEVDDLVNGVDLKSVAKIIPKHSVIKLESLETARAALESEEIRQVTVIPEDYLARGKFDVYVAKSELFGNVTGVGWLKDAIADEILKTTELDENSLNRIQRSSGYTEFEINSSGQFEKVNKLSKGLSMGLPISISGVLIMALIMNAGQLLTSIAEEKENKVMEIIVSSVSADSLLFGKVLGIVAAGLLQIAIWMSMVAAVPALSMSAFQETIPYEFKWMPMIYSLVLMVLGFVFYGCMLAGLGSMGSSYKDCQQLSVAPILLACAPLMAPLIFLSSPDGRMAQVISMIPFFSPIAMTMRLGVYEVPLWEIGLAALILIVSIFLAIKFSARLFRVGVLMQGKRPGLGLIWQVISQSS